MNKEGLIELVSDMGTLEMGEFYKHSMCFAECSLLVTSDVVEDEPMLEPFLGKKLVISGTQDYNYGFESDGSLMIFYQELEEIPEKIIPAHTLVSWKVEETL